MHLFSVHVGVYHYKPIYSLTSNCIVDIMFLLILNLFGSFTCYFFFGSFMAALCYLFFHICEVFCLSVINVLMHIIVLVTYIWISVFLNCLFVCVIIFLGQMIYLRRFYYTKWSILTLFLRLFCIHVLVHLVVPVVEYWCSLVFYHYFSPWVHCHLLCTSRSSDVGKIYSLV